MFDQNQKELLQERISYNRFFCHPNPTPIGRRGLIVFTHGLRQSPQDYMKFLTALMIEDTAPFSYSDLLPFKFKATIWANTDLRHEAQKLEQAIEDRFKTHDYQEIYLVGHSIGGLLIRQTVLTGYQSFGCGLSGENNKPYWVLRIKRLVLLASTNRGFVNTKLHRQLFFRFARLIRRSGLIRDGFRGSEFVNNLRLGWIREFERKDRTIPEVIQLRGNVDEVVGGDDSMDLYRLPNSKEIVLEGVRHGDFSGMTSAHPAYQAIREAFLNTPVTTSHRLETPLEQCRPESIRFLVFLVHGIRDFGDWQENLAHEIRMLDPAAKVISVRYGYFNIFQFLLSFQRARAVRSFVDRYIQELARFEHPQDKIKIAIAAHSNGTYVVANALKAYPQMVVHRAYLAGSVLPRGFPWHKLSPIQQQHLQEIRNDCANWDWPVGVLCNGLKFLWRDLGTAGYKGFKLNEKKSDKSSLGPVIENNRYVDGNHGAAFEPQFHKDIASFLLKGEPRVLPVEAKSSCFMQTLHRASYFLVPMVVIALGYLYFLGIPTWFPEVHNATISSAVITLFIILILVRI